MKKILAVNVDAFNLNIISNMLTEYTADFEVLTTNKIKEIDDIIRKLATDVLIVDLDDPSPADLKTLAGISKAYPRLPLIIMTAFETGEIESGVKAIGTAQYFEKPVDTKEIVELVWEKIERNVGGEVHGISLTSFLQMSEMEKTSCTLKVKAGKNEGALYMQKGALISAETGKLQNEEAVLEILSWDNPGIEIDDSPVNRRKEIQAPLISLLMESVKRKDEKKTPASKKAAAPKKKLGKQAPDALAAETPAKAAKKKADAAQGTPPPEAEEPQSLAKITDASKALKRKQLFKQATIVAMVVLVLVIAACVWQFIFSPWQAEKRFSQVVGDVTAAQSFKKKIDLLDAFLASNPKRDYVLKAKQLKQNYAGQMEVEEYERITREINALPINDNFEETARKKYLTFLKQYPGTDLKDEINKRIETIPFMMDDAEYARLKEIPRNHYSQRLMAYQAYLTRHPESVNADSVKEMKDSLGEAFYNHIRMQKTCCDEEQSWLKCIKLCDYFLNNFEQHVRTKQVSMLLSEMKSRNSYIKISEEIEKAGPMSKTAEKLFEKFLDDYPASPLRDTVESQLAQIRKSVNQEKTWQELINYVKNDQNSIFDRVDRMADYLKHQPPDSHKEDAENIHTWLLREKDRTQWQMNQQAQAQKQKQQQKVYIAQEQERVSRQIQNSEGRYKIKKRDTVYDRRTGLTWCMLDSYILSNKCMDYNTAKQYVKNLDIGGYNDWRLPDPNELLFLFNSKPAFPMSDAAWYWTSEAFHAAWSEKVNTVVRSGSGTWEKVEKNMEQCGAVKAVRP